MSSSSSKQYGLLLPEKPGKPTMHPRPSIFGEDSDSAEEGGDWVKKALKRESEKSLQKKQTKIEMERALAVDPTVYQYDEVYDKMEEKKAEEKKSKAVEKKPRYIQSLLKQAERRKKEQERRFERDIQRERQAEGEQFKDKESFVTSAYRAKLEEFRKMDEQERRMEQIEAIMDVSKQNDLSGFYRHLYRQATGEEPPSNSNQNTEVIKVKEEPQDSIATAKSEKLVKAESSEKKKLESSDKKKLESSDKKKLEHDKKAEVDKKTSIPTKGAEKHIPPTERKYRKRRASSSEREDVPTQKSAVVSKDDNKNNNGNKNNDGSDSSSSSETSSDDSSDSGEESHEPGSGTEMAKEKTVGDVQSAPVEQLKVLETSKCDKSEEVKHKVQKRNIWEKQTVGPVYDAALERYYARKAARLAR